MTQPPLYAIGDVHGQFEMLGDALEWIEADGGADARVVFLGDLVDRGPDAFRVLELLTRGQAEGRDWIVLLGNHDRMFRRFLESGDIHDARILSGKSWLHPRLGGRTTLASYGVDVTDDRPLRQMLNDARASVPQHHLDLLDNLPLWHREPGLLFVHAGIMPGIPLEAQDPDDLVWMREPFLSHPAPFEALIVHGHTALDAPVHYGNRINLDGGAGYGRPLGVAVFENDDVFLLNSFGRAFLGDSTTRST